MVLRGIGFNGKMGATLARCASPRSRPHVCGSPARSSPIALAGASFAVLVARPMCCYPAYPHYFGDDITKAEGFICKIGSRIAPLVTRADKPMGSCGARKCVAAFAHDRLLQSNRSPVRCPAVTKVLETKIRDPKTPCVNGRARGGKTLSAQRFRQLC